MYYTEEDIDDLYANADYCVAEGISEPSPFSVLELAVRGERACRDMGIGSISEIDDVSDKEFLRLPNVGYKTVAGIRTAVNLRYGRPLYEGVRVSYVNKINNSSIQR